MRYATSLVAGLLFGFGLMVSDMVNPARVLAFLDVAAIAEGAWDPTLIFVMGGAMAVSSLAWLLSYRRASAVWGGPLPAPPKQRIDLRLVGGSAVFGIGWGLVGICPGPALTGLALGGSSTAIFVAAMLAGMALYRVIDAQLRRTEAQA